MKTNQAITDRSHPHECRYVLNRGLGYWALVFEGRETVFKHELGALYVAYLLLNPPKEPLHAVALALKARERAGQVAEPNEVFQERSMGLEEAAAVRALWRRQRELERVLKDKLEIEPVKAEALRELEEVTDYLRQSPWLSRHGAERCVRAVMAAMKRFYSHLAGGVDVEGKPDEVLQAFAMHLRKHLLILSGRGGAHTRKQALSGFAGCFIYQPPRGVVWEVQSPTGGVQSLESKVQSLEPAKSKVSRLESEVQSLKSSDGRPAAVGYLSRFLCAGFALALLAPAVPARGHSKAARPSRRTSPPVSSSRASCKARTLPRPASRPRRA